MTQPQTPNLGARGGRSPRTTTLEPDDAGEIPRLDFIPVELLHPTAESGAAPTPWGLPRVDVAAAPVPETSQPRAGGEDAWAERTSLFVEPEA